MSLKVQWNPTQWRNDSSELDVFEATKYFSTNNEVSRYNGGYLSHKTMREERQALGGRRMSLDVHTTASPPSQSQRVNGLAKEEKQKQPNFPGGRLASFLKTLFHQTGSKKNKPMSSSTHFMKGVEEIPDVGRRKRRSSMSLFPSIKTSSKSVFASSTAPGFRTPPPCVETPAKIHKDIRSCSDHKHVVSLPTYSGNYVQSVTSKDKVLDGKDHVDLAWLDEKFNFIGSFSIKDKNMINKDGIWVSPEKKNVKRLIDADDGGESDASSDLFELKNYDLSAC